MASYTHDDDDAPAGIRPGGCVIDPAEEDWPAKDDAEVYNAAAGGVQQARDELMRRYPGERYGWTVSRGQHGPTADYGDG